MRICERWWNRLRGDDTKAAEHGSGGWFHPVPPNVMDINEVKEQVAELPTHFWRVAQTKATR